MSQQIVQQIHAALARFASDSRLYELTLEQEDGLGSGGLLVEAFLADDCLQEVGARDVIALSTSAHIGIGRLLGQRATLHASLADGSRTRFHGFVSHAAMLGSEGGLARYRLRMAPWLWLLTQSRNSRVWQDASVADIAESIFQQYAPHARWRWSKGMADSPQRSYCCQYRESDYDFVRRLLTEEGIAWRFEDTEDGQELVLFDDSSQQAALPEDASSAAGAGLRYHAARAGETSDTVQSLRHQRALAVGSTAVLSYDYKAKRTVSASIPVRAGSYGKSAPMLESCDYAGQYFYPNGSEAERYATLQMQAHEARANQWQARSTVRTLRAGTRITLAQGPLDEGGGEYAVLRVCSVGVNNLPGQVQHGLAELFGPVPELLEQLAAPLDGLPEDFPAVLAQARSSGYANSFEALPADMPWRPVHAGGIARQHPRPTAHGCQSAIVVGGDNGGGPGGPGAGEIHCDALGRVRIRFHWQDNADATCWVRVAQRSAGGGMGSQFLPRIGQEVLVQFIENDIDRPIIVGALYNGQGEGGTMPTPGGQAAQAMDGLFAPAHDHGPSAQGNLAGGHSPVWHGAAAASGDHRNTAAQWGVRSKEFGGGGYNQLLFDDTDSQGRIQLRTTQSATELNLGHLLHGADNFRGSLRGQGAELRSDAYGAVRGGSGLLVSTYKLAHSASQREPAGDNTAGIAMLKQAVALADTFNDSALRHGTVPLAAHVGAPEGKGSRLSAQEAPLRALQTAVSGMVDSAGFSKARDAAGKRTTATGADKLPHSADPVVAISAKEGLALSAARDLQFANGEVAAFSSGKDTQLSSGAQMRIHSNQAIGMLGGAVGPGEQGLGIQLVAARDNLVSQAQAGEMKVQARDDVNIKSSNAHIDWASAKKISLSTAGGANITIDGGNITVQCPGKLQIKAGKKNFTGAAERHYSLPVMPVTVPAVVVGRKLESTFALDQLATLAQNSSKVEFVFMMVPIFGYDLPAKSYIKLYDALRSGSVKNPDIKLMDGCHYPAEFDNETRKIHVHKAAAERAAKSRGDSWELVAALLHEFGHYIDLILRKDFTPKDEVTADAGGEEGARFAYQVAFYDFTGSSETAYADYSGPGYSGPLKANYAVVRAEILKRQGKDAQSREGKEGSTEQFGAGMGEHHKEHPSSSFGHQSIESVLERAGFNENLRKRIYFGNWLRDFSQMVDPAIVRKPGAPKSFPEKISRAHLTRLVDVLAESEFVDRPAEKAIYTVTERNLGVYRPVEHIDNPTSHSQNAPNPKDIDPDFQSPPTKQDVAIDPVKSMKHYIAASRTYMCEQLEKAVAAGPSNQGCIHFGAALHVLEDYFAHSNFIELSLRKVGFKDVLPWTSPAAGKHAYPVVTGMFDKDDVIASTAGLIAETLFKVQWEFKASKPYERTKADKIILILLEEHRDRRMLEGYKAYLAARDKWASIPGHQYAEGALHYTLGMVGNVFNWVYSTLIVLIGNSIDEEQVVRMGDPNKNGSTDPTHSQLAKDHDNHPFHILAAHLARHAVLEVGRSMAQQWFGTPNLGSISSPSAVAAAFLCHPEECTWQDSIVRSWGTANPKAVARGASATEWEALEKAHKKEVMDQIERMSSASKRSWKYVNKYYEDLFGSKETVK